MKADYYRYLAEFKQNDAKKEIGVKAEAAYKAATDHADSNLAPTHPIRLGLALNYSVFLYEVTTPPVTCCKCNALNCSVVLYEVTTAHRANCCRCVYY